ncbi:hypothetical protein [Rhodocaloribacter sp.]
MESKTASVTINVPQARLFDFVSEITNLPVWAHEFCKGLKTVNGRSVITTDQGDLLFRIDADPNTGVVDFFGGPTEDAMGCFPSRVIGLPDGSSAYLFTLFRTPDMDDAAFEAGYASLRRELDTLKSLLE